MDHSWRYGETLFVFGQFWACVLGMAGIVVVLVVFGVRRKREREKTEEEWIFVAKEPRAMKRPRTRYVCKWFFPGRN